MLLRKIADVMRRMGHAREIVLDRNGGVCLLGAIYFAEAPKAHTDRSLEIGWGGDGIHDWLYQPENRHLMKDVVDQLKLFAPNDSVSRDVYSENNYKAWKIAAFSNGSKTEDLLAALDKAADIEEAEALEVLDFPVHKQELALV